MTYIGAAILEDILQDQVKEIVNFIKYEDKIKIWMVTDDKMENVERIGRISGIIDPSCKR